MKCDHKHYCIMDFEVENLPVKCLDCGEEGRKSSDGTHNIWGKFTLNEDEELINKIERIRSKNNKSWMDLVRLAFKHSPAEAKQIMQKIVKYDKKISKLSSKLANEVEV